MKRTRLAMTASMASIALALAGCGLLGGEEEPAPEQEPPPNQEPAASDGGGDQMDDLEGSDGGGSDGGGSEDDTGTDAGDDTEDDSGDQDSSGDDSGDEAAGGDNSSTMGEVAAPGTQGAVGDTHTLHVQALEEGDEFYGYAVVGTTVTEVEEGDPAIFDRFDEEDQADLEGMTPWYVHTEHELLSIEGEPNANMIPTVSAQDASGARLGGAVSFGGGLSDVCGVEVYEEKTAGATATNCSLVFTEGEPPAQIVWEGDAGRADGSGDENPYRDDPVVWTNEG